VIGGASVVVSASDVVELATVAGCSSDALIAGARIVVVALWAHAGLTARAESQTSSTALRAGNIDARGNDEGIQDTTQLREVRGEESGLDTRERGGDVLNFTSHGISDTNSEEDDASVFSIGHNSGEGTSLLIVSTISQKDDNLVHSRSGITAGQFLVSGLNTTTNASHGSSWGHTIDGVKEGLLIGSKSNDQSSSSGEHHKTHLNILRAKNVVSSNVSTEFLFVCEGLRINGTRLIEHEHEVNFLGAFGRRTSPAQRISESVAGNCSKVGKLVCLAVGEDSSARDLASIHINGGNSRGSGALLISIAGSSSNGGRGRIGRSGISSLFEENRHGNIVSG